MASEERHYFEIANEDMPGRARPDESDDAASKKAARAESTPTAPVSANAVAGEAGAYDASRAFVAIDYRGDRAESEWRSVGERIPSLLWRILLVLAIIGVFFGLFATCGHVVIYFNR